MAPDFCARMIGRTARVMAARPKTLVSNMARMSRVVALLDRREVAVAGVVHEHVDAAELLPSSPSTAGGDLGRLVDIELQRQRVSPSWPATRSATLAGSRAVATTR